MKSTSGLARSSHHVTFSSRAFSELTFHVAMRMPIDYPMSTARCLKREASLLMRNAVLARPPSCRLDSVFKRGGEFRGDDEVVHEPLADGFTNRESNGEGGEKLPLPPDTP